MKLLLCTECYDVLKLRSGLRSCSCGKAGGKYARDGRTAKIFGPSRVIGIDNGTLSEAIRKTDKDGVSEGRDVVAFLFSKNHPRIQKLGLG